MEIERRIVKLQFGKPEGGACDRENAVVMGRFGDIIGFWDVTEPEFRRCFEGRDYAYFFADIEDGGARVRHLEPAPDQEW